MTIDKEPPACGLLRERTKGLTQDQIAERLDCTQPVVSNVLAGKARLNDRRRALALHHWQIPLDAWLLPSEQPAAFATGEEEVKFPSSPPLADGRASSPPPAVLAAPPPSGAP